jgi:hypothetical protein
METVSKKVLETYKNIYLGPFLNKKEQYDNSSSDSNNSYDPLFSLVAWIIFLFAVYLSFRCNNGFSVWGILGAIFLSPFYIIYKLTSDYKNCRFK